MKSIAAMRLTLIFLITLTLFSNSAKGQDTLTVGQVYDFDINDQFHYTRSDYPPNATRITITGKYFSDMMDTVFYVRFCDKYSTYVEYWPEPHLVYYFNSYTDTINYTNLSTPICNLFNDWPINDTLGSWFSDTIYYSSRFCGVLTYEYYACSNCIFEGDYYNGKLGQGVGLLEFWHMNSGNPGISYEYTMIYYKKGTFTCGIPDLTTGITHRPVADNAVFFITPNPVLSSFILHNNSQESDYQCILYDASGQQIMSADLSDETNSIDISHLRGGIYFLKIIAEDQISSIKLIKK